MPAHWSVSFKYSQLKLEAKSRFAYVSKLFNPNLAAQRGFLISFLVAAESLRRAGVIAVFFYPFIDSFNTGSTHDIVLQLHKEPSEDVKRLLERENILHVVVADVSPEDMKTPQKWLRESGSNRFSFIKMTQYDMVLFFDSDVIFKGNPDSLFDENYGKYDCVATGDGQSPVNGGFVLVKTSLQAYVNIEDIVNLSQKSAFNHAYGGWLSVGPAFLYPSTSPYNWYFSSSGGYQGMLYYYYFRRPDHPPSKLYGARGSQYGWGEADAVATHFQGEKPFSKELSSLPLEDYRDLTRLEGLRLWRQLEPIVTARVINALGPVES